MKIKQTYLNEGEKVIEIEHDSLCIMADDGRELFTISLEKDGSIEVCAASVVKHNDTILDNLLSINPRASNTITVFRREYKH